MFERHLHNPNICFKKKFMPFAHNRTFWVPTPNQFTLPLHIILTTQTGCVLIYSVYDRSLNKVLLQLGKQYYEDWGVFIPILYLETEAYRGRMCKVNSHNGGETGIWPRSTRFQRSKILQNPYQKVESKNQGKSLAYNTISTM